jgi:hypothetical protein
MVMQTNSDDRKKINDFFAEHVKDLPNFQRLTTKFPPDLMNFRLLTAKIHLNEKCDDALLTFF